jgi:hypothetical protein
LQLLNVWNNELTTLPPELCDKLRNVDITPPSLCP